MFETATLVGVIVALVQVIKMSGLPGQFAPLMSLFLGIIGAVALNGVAVEVVFEGIVVGLTASGLYSGTKAVIG